MPPRPPARIALVDDHPVIGVALASLLSTERGLTFVGQATTVPDMHHLLAHDHPDLLLLDLSLPDGNGLELLPTLQVLHDALPVLVYSMCDPVLYAERAIRAGAAGYVSKDAPTRQLLQALHSVLHGELYLAPAAARRMMKQYARQQRDHPLPSPLADLTNRELAVLQLLGRGNTQTAISEHLNVSPKTIERVQRQIRQKLGLRTPGDVLHKATEVAYGGTASADAR